MADSSQQTPMMPQGDELQLPAAETQDDQELPEDQEASTNLLDPHILDAESQQGGAEGGPQLEEQDPHPPYEGDGEETKGLDEERGGEDQRCCSDTLEEQQEMQMATVQEQSASDAQQCDNRGGDHEAVRVSDQVVDHEEQEAGGDPEKAEHQGPPVHHSSDQDPPLPPAPPNLDDAGESGGSVPALVITQAEEPRGLAAAGSTPSPEEPERPAELIPAPARAPRDRSVSSSSDGGDMTSPDLASLRSDSLSLTSELNISRRGEEDDTRSVAASSVMSLFHRVQLDPLERDWLRSSALGNMGAQRQLLAQDPSLVLKKTALHWAAKQGRQEAVDMMLRSGADVNVRSGYTALHLASIHGHQHIVHSLINTHNAKTNIRDYHGKMAAHYWSDCTDVFNNTDSQSGGRFSRGRWTQRYALPSLLLSRSRSQGQLNLEFRTLPQSALHDVLDLQV